MMTNSLRHCTLWQKMAQATSSKMTMMKPKPLATLSIFLLLTIGMVGNSQAANDIATIYADSCATCHDTGALNAPKTGDVAVWKRLEDKKGMAGLVNSVKNGMTQMPAGGLCSDCSDQQYQQLIEYMMKPKAQ
ncbi:c-type cytochrome [Psychrobacter sp. I-STPA6b]|uniref:c-type cytochrome n=1 Tax=Psychrobacter sp. I-STPA6b TaxID=2585718 RepID=UPI0022219665|nr:c-type cytochrome [Psychrobacter sp. I-STPA6b]